MTTIEERLKTARKNAGFSQKDLAKNLGITARTLQRYEKDASKMPIEIMTNISHLCDADLVWLITGDGGNKKDIKGKTESKSNSESSNITKVIHEHQDLIKRFKNPEVAKEATEDLIELESIHDGLYADTIKHIKTTLNAARIMKGSTQKKQSQNESSTKKRANEK
ncbi:MAG: helix-turn-helix transcriptional regulator [Proteobacteria bacterium]|nr:helix-turn-helix transcriptional regulator [Desulfobacula sp.]MBU3951004.1 helix-turn-helix transcriptional regulator [Pseudomonadota bacterium]MBU4131572.1 helix-turn-helix transcriptional regulator [Pseudomonadota bacterium]